MNQNLKILFIGGDKRQIYAADFLKAKGFDVCKTALEKDFKSFDEYLEQIYDVFVLPAPVSKDKKTIFAPLCENSFSTKEFLRFSPPKAIIGGGFDIFENKFFDTKTTKVFDLLKSDEYNTLIAEASAEGAIFTTALQTKTNISGSEILVAGFGKIGKLLAIKLKNLNAKIYVAARSEKDRSLAKVMGFEPVDFFEISALAKKFDNIFNTVPSLVITKEIIKNLKKDCIITDVASAPGGTDFETAERFGIKTLWELGIPGRYAPKTSGEIIAQTVIKISNGINSPI